MDKEQVNGPMIDKRGGSRRSVLRGALGGATTAALLAAGWTIETVQAQGATPAASPGAVEGPVKVVIQYVQPSDPAAFEEYYLEMHLPMVLEVPGVQRFEAGRAVTTSPRNPAALYRIVSLYFADFAAMEAALASPEGKAVIADLVTLVTGGELNGATATVVADLVTIPGQDGAATPVT